MPLLRYLIGELLMSEDDRGRDPAAVRPTAQNQDWEIDIAGQRVQVIRRDAKKLGVLEFGTTVLAAADGSIAGLLGASRAPRPRCRPCSTSCSAASRPLPGLAAQAQEMVPSLGVKLSDNPALFEEVWTRGTRVLGLESGAEAGRAALSAGPDARGTETQSGEPEPAGVVTVALRRSWAKDLDAAATLYELLKLRVEVFVVEQACPYPELDGRDLLAETRHFWLEQPDGEVIATLRLMEEHPAGTRASASGGCTSAPPADRATPPGAAGRAGRGGRPSLPDQRPDLPGRHVRPHGFVADGEEFRRTASPTFPC